MERQKPCKKQAETAAEAPSVLTYLARVSSYRAGVGHSIPVTPQSIPGMRMFVSDGWWRHHHLDMYGWTQAQRRAQCLAYCGYTLGSVVQRVCILQAPTFGCGHFSVDISPDHCMTKSCTAQTTASADRAGPTLLGAVHGTLT